LSKSFAKLHVADRVDEQRRVRDLQLFEHPIEHLDHFGLNRRVVARAQHFRTDLIELPVTPGLRAFAAEHRADVIELRHLTGRLVGVELVLDVGTHDRGRVFGPERERFALAVGPRAVNEGVHLFVDDVGGFADAAREEFCLLEDRRANLAEPVTPEGFARRALDAVPQRHVGGQDVSGSSDGLNHAVLAVCALSRRSSRDAAV
jgi:hypothetical protein